jgi:putative intracellular protease/amidase
VYWLLKICNLLTNLTRGLPGAQIIADNDNALKMIKTAVADGKMVAGICAAPALALAANGFVNGKNITCYPAKAFIDAINKCANYTGKDVEVDGNFITANGPRSAMIFSIAICEYLRVTPKF